MYADRDEGAGRQRAIELLADEARLPIDDVARLFEDERAALQAGARITGFLAILTSSMAREMLRQRSHFPARDSNRRAVTQ